MKSPVIFIVFNRPVETQKVFDRIREYKPEKLLVISDGPGNNEVRNIIEKVDWPCEVLKNYSDINLGCKNRLSTGLTWAFQKVDRAIVLEDDCLPNQSFFKFCEELLEKYKDDEEIMHISGSSFEKNHTEFGYDFSKFPNIWGWASWARAWKHYDPDIKKWPEIKKTTSLKEKFYTEEDYNFWSKLWDSYYEGKVNSWDGQWLFACMLNDGLCINPKENLIKNIGFSASATHTKVPNEGANLETIELEFPLKHPESREVKPSNYFTLKQI